MKKTGVPEWQPLEQAVPVDLFLAEVKAWAERLGVAPAEIRIQPLKRKWASCSSRGRLTFDTALLRQPAQFRREVIVHELVHLKVPNHGRVFRALLKAYLNLYRNNETPS
ncbi:MAG: M48 family metallopeptidase [Verrucomicrobiota bacterium]|nr:M48 family metallopeptidase [Limisphaera sp.]MDW8383002.1 M48 family metallopeptidase [Verrucomicrobiota bacterium]